MSPSAILKHKASYGKFPSTKVGLGYFYCTLDEIIPSTKVGLGYFYCTLDENSKSCEVQK